MPLISLSKMKNMRGAKIMKIEELIAQSLKIFGTKRALATFLDCTERTIYRWSSGRASPTAKNLSMMIDIVAKKGRKTDHDK